ncbi:hypothetical protein SB49_09600 [Sediminicola sp. YIK13]|uniref:hypothetical protein n=1 Tax=Sediminicola sp. YIK13 TaxID=1453352 RepID=UPI00071EFED3|nr:hypothetical protein [Sediminicola sp. YIK13]ALM08025.1 hypothetical protein SB49_09600 [Sediminicola sp. YIK13]
MNVSDFTFLLQHPNKVVSPVQTKHLEDIIEEYPYFQAARAVHLKGLKNLNSFKFNNALKITAAHTTDRDVLFDFITSRDFLQNAIADSISGRSLSINEHEIISEEVGADAPIETLLNESSEDKPLPQNVKEAEQILDPTLFKSMDPHMDEAIAKAKKEAEKELEIGKPLPFTKKEKYSFTEWLQLTSATPIEREPLAKDSKDLSLDDVDDDEEMAKKKKFDLIDKFIENNPKIVPREKIDKVDISESLKMDKNELMTETLARVYLEQKKYKKAIQAYKILSLKYPEKSSFFADRIKTVEKIQKEN